MRSNNRQSIHTHSLLMSWLLSHARAIRFALLALKETPVVNFMTICIIGIAIALPLGFFVILKNLQCVNASWGVSAPTISLYLKTNTSVGQVHALMQSLRADAEIAKVSYISPEDGLKTFENSTPFSDVIALLKNNPIPGVITVVPASRFQNPAAMNTLFSSLKVLPLVDIAQLDMNWVARLYDVINIGKQLTKVLSILFGLGVILMIGHTLRTSLSNHIHEIQVMRLIGATNGYIRRPLLYRGVLYGLLGGFVAWILIAFFIHHLQSPVSQLAETYQTIFNLQTISFLQGILLLCVSAVLGFVGAWFIATQFLNRSELVD